MRILVIDGQGGGMGSRLIAQLKPQLPSHCELICVGTNSLATSAMMKAGALRGATGEHAIVYNAQRAHIILGPIGIILNHGIMGEVSSAMSAAVSGAEAYKILIPSSTCGVHITGVVDVKREEHLKEAVALTMAQVTP